MTKHKLGDKKTNVMSGDYLEILGKVYEPQEKDKWLEIEIECELQVMDSYFGTGTCLCMNPDWLVWGDNNAIWKFVPIKILSITEIDAPDLDPYW